MKPCLTGNNASGGRGGDGGSGNGNNANGGSGNSGNNSGNGGKASGNNGNGGNGGNADGGECLQCTVLCGMQCIAGRQIACCILTKVSAALLPTLCWLTCTRAQHLVFSMFCKTSDSVRLDHVVTSFAGPCFRITFVMSMH